MLLQKLTAKDRKQHVTYSKPCSAPHNRVTEASELNSMISEPQHVHSASFMTSVTSACLSLASYRDRPCRRHCFTVAIGTHPVDATVSAPQQARPCRPHCFSVATGQTLATQVFRRRHRTDAGDATVSALLQGLTLSMPLFQRHYRTDPVNATVSSSLQDRPCQRHCFIVTTGQTLSTPLFQRDPGDATVSASLQGQTLSTPLFQRHYRTDPVDATVSARSWQRHCFSVATGTDPGDASVSCTVCTVRKSYIITKYIYIVTYANQNNSSLAVAG